MRAYIISIAAASVISAITSMIAPEKWTKYVGLVTGLVITLCIGRPVLDIMRTDVFEGMNFQYTPSVTYDNTQYRSEIIAEMEKTVGDDVRERLKNEFNADCEVKVTLGINEKNEITGIEKFDIVGGNLDSVAMGRLRDIYEVHKIEYRKH